MASAPAQGLRGDEQPVLVMAAFWHAGDADDAVGEVYAALKNAGAIEGSGAVVVFPTPPDDELLDELHRFDLEDAALFVRAESPDNGDAASKQEQS